MDDISTTLRKYLTRDNPIGPIAHEEIRSKKVAARLFDRENKIYAELARRPAYIFGRRGAGKTAFIRNISRDGYSVVVHVKAWETFSQVILELGDVEFTGKYVEQVAEVWEMLLWTAVIQKIGGDEPEDPDVITCRALSEALRVRSANTGDKPIKTMARAFRRIAGTSPGITTSAMQDVEVRGKVSFSDARRCAEHFLEKEGTRALILMDSLEDYALSDERTVAAMGGLFKCITHLNSPESLCDIRCCFPSEVWYILRSSSKNPLKDFASRIRLQWHASELVSILAHRLKTYIDLHEDAFAAEHKVHLLNTEDRDDALRLVSLLMPPTITNEFETLESTVAYMFRHTQLLPRQLLVLFRTVFEKNRRFGGINTVINERAVKEGVAEAAKNIVFEIFQAFESVHPTAQEICVKCVGELPQVFNLQKLEEVYRWHVKKVMHAGDDFDDFKEILIRVGCLGKMTRETEKYFIGEFQYSGDDDELTVNSTDDVCIHPIFRRRFGAKSDAAHAKAVYPFGTGIEDEDKRNWWGT